MSKIGIVAKFEIIRQLKKPSFWISLLLLPVAIFAIIGLSALSSYSLEDTISNTSTEDGKSGLFDEAGILDGKETGMIIITSEQEGIDKVKNGELEVFYHVVSDFNESHKVKIYDQAEKTGLMNFYQIPFANILKQSVYEQLSANDIALIEGAIDFETIDLDINGNPTSVLGKAIIPLAVLAIFYILICVFGNRLTMALVEEKENRISEMLLTSISSKYFVIGKIISLIALGFIQIAVFVIPIIAALFIYRDNPQVASIINIIDWDPIRIIENILLLLMSYFLFAGACTFIGSLCPTARDASQYIGVIMVGIVMPLFFMQVLMTSETTIVTYILSYFPLSSPIALMMRNAFGNLPTYELIIGIVELAVASAFILIGTVKSFQKNAINFSVVKPHFGVKKSWKR